MSGLKRKRGTKIPPPSWFPSTGKNPDGPMESKYNFLVEQNKESTGGQSGFSKRNGTQGKIGKCGRKKILSQNSVTRVAKRK